MENENTEEEGSEDHLLVIGDAGEDTVGSGSEYETVRSLDIFAHPRRPLQQVMNDNAEDYSDRLGLNISASLAGLTSSYGQDRQSGNQGC